MSDNLNREPISILIGKPSRIYKEGSPVTDDYIPDRVNIEVSQSGEIVKIWMG